MRVLFVCLGNICRSPTAEAVLRHRADARGLALTVASCGTGAWHEGGGADARSLAVLTEAGYRLDHTARQLRPEWLEDHDLVIAMDRANLAAIEDVRPGARAHLLREWDPLGPGDVPDPYAGGPDGFRDVLTMVERCCDALLTDLLSTGAVHSD